MVELLKLKQLPGEMMSQWFRLLTSYGSILGATLMLLYGGYLIRKNSPAPSVYEVQFTPPVSPDSQPDSQAGGRASNTPPSNTSSRKFIGGVGIIEPAGEAISIGSQLAGVVFKVFVTPGDKVKQGDPLFVLDDRTARANIEVARAQLASQNARLQELLGQIAPQRYRVEAAKAKMSLAEANLRFAQKELKRVEILVANNAVSAEELDQSQLNVAVADAQTGECRANYEEAFASLQLLSGKPIAPSIEVQNVAVEQAKASLAREEVALSLHTVVAPKDSTVLQVKVRAGEFIPAAVLSTPLISLGVTEPLHVRVDIDEADIARFHQAAKAYASVRGRPDLRVTLDYVRTEPYVIPKKSLGGGVSERVDTRVLQIIYSVDPRAIQASPGQQVDVYIEETKHGV